MVAAGHHSAAQNFRWRTIACVPRGFHTAWIKAFMVVAQWIAEEPLEAAPWLLLYMLPLLLLRVEARGGTHGGSNGGLAARLVLFSKGDWQRLWEAALRDGATNVAHTAARSARAAAATDLLSPVDAAAAAKDARTKRALKLAVEGSPSAALSAMEGLGSAPPTEETYELLQSLHPADPGGDHPVPDNLKREGDIHAAQVNISRDDVLKAVTSAPKRKSEDGFGWKVEFIVHLMSDSNALDALSNILQYMCRGSLPELTAAAFRSARLVALLKPDPGGVRPIGIPLVWRRVAGRIFNARCKDALMTVFIGLEGRVVQFALGRPSGPQSMSIAIQELLAANPTWVLISLDVKNAFNSLSRLAMAKGVMTSPMKYSFGFFHMCYHTPAQLIYHAASKVYKLMSRSGATQGTADGMQHFSLGQHPLLVEAATPYDDVHILSDADDSNIIGPPDQVTAAVRDVNRLFAENGLILKKADILLGADLTTMENDPTGTAADTLRADIESIIGEGKVTVADSGVIAGAGSAHADGIRIVGTPVGSEEFAAAFVEGQVDKHSQRLTNITLLGTVCPQVGLLLLYYCCIRRMNYLMQVVPFSVAPTAYSRARQEIITAWRKMLDINDDDMAGHGVKERIALPYYLGGQNIPDFQTAGNAAAAGCWAAVACDLKYTVKGLRDLGDPGTWEPRWGHIRRVFDWLIAAGPHVTAVLPDLEATYIDATPRLQGKLLHALYQTDYEKFIANTAEHPSDYRDVAESRCAQARSCNHEGALAWHLVFCYAKHLMLSPTQVKTVVRFETGMKQPGLAHGHRPNLNHMAADANATVVGHKALNMASTGRGGYYTTHNAIVRVLMTIMVACGLNASTNCRALIGALEDTDTDTVGDLHVVGLNNCNNGLLIDVSLTHPISAKGKAKHRAAHESGHAALQVTKRKARRYGDLPAQAGMEFCAFVLETYGWLTQDATDLLKRLAKHHAENIDIMRLSARDSTNALAGRRYRQWLQAISIARVRTIADRIQGAAATALANVARPRDDANAFLNSIIH